MSTSAVEMSVEALGSTSNVPAPTEEQDKIDIPSLQLKLGACYPEILNSNAVRVS